MTAAATTVDSAVLHRAREVVDLGLQACDSYDRPDLATRLTRARQTVDDPAVHIVVAGEFKQGKSSLVNALLGASVCPVDDDVATAVPTYLRHGREQEACLVFDGDPPRREVIGLDDVRRHVLEAGRPAAPGPDRLIGVEVRLPRTMLATGLIIVDTPGVGGLGSAHAAASLAAIAMADAVLFVSDASQELTASELDFLRQARDLCRAVVCVQTKIDFYPAWRRIRDINEGHLRGLGDVPVISVSSTVRMLAVAANDRPLNAESGYADLVHFVTERVGTGAANRAATDAVAEVVAVAEQLSAQFEAERAALADPAAARRIVDELNVTRQRVEQLRSVAAKWSQTLNDGIADLNADIDHDLRSRLRAVAQETDDALETADPADTWSRMESWLQSRVSYDMLTNYGLLRTRADALSEVVAEHFREASGPIFNQLAVFNPTRRLSDKRVEHRIELERMKAGKSAMVMLKSATGGVLMFTVIGSLAGIALGPIAIGIGLVMGHKGLRDEKKRQLLARRTQARNAIRRYCDEVTFVMGKDSRDTLRRIQRQLRDHYAALADQLSRSNTEAVTAATEAAKRTQAERDKRLRDVDAELARLAELRRRAEAIRPAA